MVKRILDANLSDFRQMSGRDLVESIRLSEGRVVAAEVVASSPPLVDSLSNAELAAAMGADLILLNLFDVTRPQVAGFPDQGGQREDREPAFGRYSQGLGVSPAMVKDWIGRPVGINLEPLPETQAAASPGRVASPANARTALDHGADFIVLTANPHTGVTTSALIGALERIRARVGDDPVLFVGKMHRAGSAEPVVAASDIHSYAAAGADGVALPAPGTVPGMTVEAVRDLVDEAHVRGLLAMTGIGTSQEGASLGTIEQLALMSKMAGADIHHIGDAGILGMAVPENITAWSVALRGRRHTWHRMAASLRR